MTAGEWTSRVVGMGAALALLLVGLPGPARADGGPVTVTSTGPARIVTDSDSSTGRIVATFTITDPTLTATGATVCRSYGANKRQGCRYERFDGQVPADQCDEYSADEACAADDDEYTRWDVAGAPGAWTVSYPIGFDPISREQCLTAAWKKTPFIATMEVQNDAGAVIGTGNFTYTVTCTGIEGNSAGPERTRVYAGRSTASKSFGFLVLDTTRVLSSYRICQYSSISGRYFNCDRERLTSRHRTDDGNWFVSYNLTFQAMGSSLCSYIGRKWPQAGFRVQFYDRDLDSRLTLFQGTRLDC